MSKDLELLMVVLTPILTVVWWMLALRLFCLSLIHPNKKTRKVFFWISYFIGMSIAINYARRSIGKDKKEYNLLTRRSKGLDIKIKVEK